MDTILLLREDIPAQDPVEKMYINLAADTDPDYYLKFGRRVVPTYNTFQLALDLFQDQRLSSAQVVKVAVDLMQNFSFGIEELQNSLDELIRRPVLADTTVAAIVPVLKENYLIRQDFELVAPAKSVVSRVGPRIFELESVTEPWVPERVDYIRDDR